MSRILAFVVFCLSLASCGGRQSLIPYGWHLATQAECDAETAREMKEMNAAGWYGDPPISIGMFQSNGHDAYDENPCGYSDGKGNFRTRYTHTAGTPREDDFGGMNVWYDEDITKEEYCAGAHLK